MWLVYAFGSAGFAGVTAILAKIGIKNTDSNLATAIRTVVILFFSWMMVFVVGSQHTVASISAGTLLFLALSGLATGASWLCYFRALQLGDVNKVTPIDKSSIILTMLLAFLILGETLTFLKVLSMVAIGTGTWFMIEWKKTAPEPQKERTGRGKGGKAGDGEAKAEKAAKAGEGAVRSAIGEDVERPGKTDAGKTSAGQAGRAAVQQSRGRKWMVYAVFSAVFASLTSILGKIGIEGVESNLGTALRTIVVLVMAWVLVFVSGKQREFKQIDAKSLLFICLSGVTTGLSWLCYYKALQMGEASVVVPVDKLSIVITVAFSWIFLKERLSKKSAAGLLLIVVGTLLLLV